MASSKSYGGPTGKGKTVSGKHVMPMSASHKGSATGAKSTPGKGGKSGKGGKKGGMSY